MNINLLALKGMEQGLDKNLSSITTCYVSSRRVSLPLLLLIRGDDPVHPLPVPLHDRVLLIKFTRVGSVIVASIGIVTAIVELFLDVLEWGHVVVIFSVGVHKGVVIINLLFDLHSS